MGIGREKEKGKVGGTTNLFCEETVTSPLESGSGEFGNLFSYMYSGDILEGCYSECQFCRSLHIQPFYKGCG